MRTTTLLAMLFCLPFWQRTALAGNGDPAAEEQRQYQQDIASARALNTRFSEGMNNELKTLQDVGDTFDKKWSGRNKECHARLLLEICKALCSGSVDTDRRNDMARRYALSALDKPDQIPLALELELIGYMMTPRAKAQNPANFVQLRKEDVTVRLHAWRRLTDALDPNWDPDEIIMGPNVIPPVATQLPSGVSPKAIKDPKLRAEYEADIRENRQKIEKYGEQHDLRDWMKRYPKRAEEYIVQIYSQPPLNRDELRQTLDVYLTDKEAKARIIKAVESIGVEKN